MGFSAPLGKWFMEGIISLDTTGIWGNGASMLIQKKVNAHLKQREDQRLFLWNIFLLTEFIRRQSSFDRLLR